MKIRRGDINVLPFFGRPTSSSGVTERPRDALCQLKPCEMLHFNKNTLQWIIQNQWKWHESIGHVVKGKGSPYSIAKRRVTELIPVLCSQPAGDLSHKPGGRPTLLSARPAASSYPRNP